MGDMAEDFRAMREYSRKKKQAITPSRVKTAKRALEQAGIHYSQVDHGELLVDYYIKFWPYTGWWSGKGIGSGRGLRNLLDKIRSRNETEQNHTV